MKLGLLFAGLLVAAFAAEPAQELVQLARKSPQSAAFKEKLMAATKAEDRKAGKAWAGYLGDFVFAVDTTSTPVFFWNEAPGPKPVRLKQWTRRGLRSSPTWCSLSVPVPARIWRPGGR